MPTEPVFLRWEHTTPPHYKFYEVDVERSRFYPKVLTRRRQAHGYRLVQELWGAALTEKAA